MLQDVTVTVKDGALGILPEATDKIFVLLGVCSGLAPNAMMAVNSTDALATLGYGPLAEASAFELSEGSGKHYVMAMTQSTAGAASAVTQPGAGTPPAVGVTGTPYDSYDARVVITKGGALGTSTFRYSLDAGSTWSGDAATSSTFPIPNTGLTLTFAAGTYVLADAYTFTTSAPYYSTSDINTAYDALLLDEREWGVAYLVGSPGGGSESAKASNLAAVAAAVQTKMTAAESKYRFARAVIEAPDFADGGTAIASAMTTVSAPRVSYVTHWGKVTSALTGRQHTVNLARVLVARLARKPLGKDPSQTEATDPGTGPLPAAIVSLKHDEAKLAGVLDAARAVTVRTYVGLTGFYITNWNLLSPAGSDFKYIQLGQVIDNACKVARNRLLRFLSLDLDLNDDFTLDEGQAVAIDSAVEQDLRASLVQNGHATGAEFRANRTDNVQATETIRGSVRVKPKFYPKKIEVDVGFKRLQAAAPT